MIFYLVIANKLLSVSNKDVETKKKQRHKKKALKKVTSIENSISPGDPSRTFFGAQDCVLGGDMMLLIAHPEC